MAEWMAAAELLGATGTVAAGGEAAMGGATFAGLGAGGAGAAAGGAALGAGAAGMTAEELALMEVTGGATATGWGTGTAGAGLSGGGLLAAQQSAASSFGGGFTPSLAGIRSGLDIGSGLYGLTLANKMRKASDPFGPYRAQYGAQLAQLQANPSSITSRPGYQAGLEGVSRRMAAGGYTGSGNEMAALSQYGQDFYGKEVDRLSSLAGGGVAPGAGLGGAANLTGQSLASIGYGVAPYTGAGQGGTNVLRTLALLGML